MSKNKENPAAFIKKLEADLNLNHLSKHPFYQLWNEGKLSMPALRDYAKQYYHFVAYFPRLVSQIHVNTPDKESRMEIVDNLYEEENPKHPHENMWIRFAQGIGVSIKELETTKALPQTARAINTMRKFCESSFTEGAAAVLSYEAQISDIAELKQRGLKKFYGVKNKDTLEFFKVHGVVDIEHQKTWKRMLAKHAQTKQQRKRAQKALNESLKSLWHLLDGVYSLHYQKQK